MIHRIQLLTDSEEIHRLCDFIRQYPLDYPDYFVWIEKCRRELELGYKKAFYAVNSNDKIVGSIIFQPHKQEKEVLEIKNLRVDPCHERQGISSILESLIELYARESRFRRIQTDTHPQNPTIEFLEKRGYVAKALESLYDAKKEVILVKDI